MGPQVRWRRWVPLGDTESILWQEGRKDEGLRLRRTASLQPLSLTGCSGHLLAPQRPWAEAQEAWPSSCCPGESGGRRRERQDSTCLPGGGERLKLESLLSELWGMAAVFRALHTAPGASGLSCHQLASLPDCSPQASSPPPSAGPSSARLAAAPDPCVLLAPGCRGSAPHRDMSLARGLAPSLLWFLVTRWKSHGRKLKLEVKLRENTYLGKDPQNYLKERKDKKKKKKINKTPDAFRQFERQNSSLQLMKIKREKPPREGKTPARISKSVFCQHGQKGEDSKERVSTVTRLDF